MLYGPEEIRRIFIVSFPVLGDALLTTPLITAFRSAYPKAKIHVLVRTGVQGIFEGNPDIDRVLTMARRPSLSEQVPLIRRIYRRYDIAVSTSYVDRAIVYCMLAARRRVAMIPSEHSEFGQNRWWKKQLVQHWESFDESKHFLHQTAELLEQLGIEQEYRPTPPSDPDSHSRLAKLLGRDWAKTDTIALQTSAGRPDKHWTESGWAAAARHYFEQGYKLVYLGGNSEDEKRYTNEIITESGVPGENLAGLTSLADVTCLLRHAVLYIGVDTCNSHLAAACGTPTVALFGPTNAVKWAPYPLHGTDQPTPLPPTGTKVIGNVAVVRPEPALAGSPSLATLSTSRVLAVSDPLLDDLAGEGGD